MCQLIASPNNGENDDDDAEWQAKGYFLSFNEDGEIRKTVDDPCQDGCPPSGRYTCRAAPFVEDQQRCQAEHPNMHQIVGQVFIEEISKVVYIGRLDIDHLAAG